MQQVYAAIDLSFGRKVALKAPKNLSAVKRFSRSARMSAKVNHVNVATTLDYFEEGGRSYLVEELIDGRDLESALEFDFLHLDPHLSAHLIHHIAKGVAASHHVGVFHRDLKPRNIMVSRDPGLKMVKVTDFGIAKMAEEEIADAFKDDKSSITGSQTALGALPYMSPEMIEEPKTASLPADVWAVGAIFFTILSGAPPFGKGLRAIPKIAAAILPPKPQMFLLKPQFAPLTDELWGIVQECLRKEPGARPVADRLVEMCSKLCYSEAPRELGIIKTYGRPFKKTGYIQSESGEEVFFHSDSFYGVKPAEGTRVNFACFAGSPHPRGDPVLPLKSMQP
jgi:serine/threonine-protein kinase